jgi:hypothetical protein
MLLFVVIQHLNHLTKIRYFNSNNNNRIFISIPTMAKKNPKKDAVKSAATTQLKRNNKNEIIQWSSASDDGRILKMLVQQGVIKEDMKPGDVRKKYTMFNEYDYKCFASALANTRKSLQSETAARVPQTGTGGANGMMKSYPVDDDDEDDEDDEDFEIDLDKCDLDDDDDSLSFDTFSVGCAGVVVGGKSVTFNAGASVYSAGARSIARKKSNLKTNSNYTKVSSSTMVKTKPLTCIMPYIADYWHDKTARPRVSLQVQLPSFGKDMQSRICYRVASSQQEFVVTVPMSVFLTDETASNAHVLASLDKEDSGHNHDAVLNYHPKTMARQLFLSKLKKVTASKVMECRIPLKMKVCLDYATESQGDPYFYGHRLITYSDGSTHLHVELVADVAYVPSTTNDRVRHFTVPASVHVPSVGGSEDGSYMEYTYTSKTGGKSPKSTSSYKSSKAGFSGGASVASSIGAKSAKSMKTAPVGAIPPFAGTKRKLHDTAGGTSHNLRSSGSKSVAN